MRASTLEFGHTAALTEGVIDLADFVKHGSINSLLKLALHLSCKLLAVLVDRIAHFLTVLNKLVRIGLIVAMFHDLLY